LATTEGNPEVIVSSVTVIQDDIPPLPILPSVQAGFELQEQVTSDMANRLESLAGHYGQMDEALRDKEAGMELSEDDLHGKEIYGHAKASMNLGLSDMNRDVDELPSIEGELEDYAEKLQSSLYVDLLLRILDLFMFFINRNDMIKSKENYQQACLVQEEFLERLDMLGDLMDECLLQQQDVKVNIPH